MVGRADDRHDKVVGLNKPNHKKIKGQGAVKNKSGLSPSKPTRTIKKSPCKGTTLKAQEVAREQECVLTSVNEYVTKKKKKKHEHACTLVCWAICYMEEYNAATAVQIYGVPMMQRAMTWSPPLRFSFKINVDGAVEKATGKAGVGVIVRDELGRVEAAMCRNLGAPLGEVETEVKAIEAGILFAQDIGVRDIVVESDCLTMIQALNGTFAPPSVVSAVIQGILDISKGFHRVEFSHVKRQENRPAHVLSKHALGIDNFIARIEETSCFLEQALITT